MFIDNEKEIKLENLMAEYAASPVAVAFSGGADSSLLLKLACESAKKYAGKHAKNQADKNVGDAPKVYAITANTNLHPTGDMENARKVALEMGAEYVELELDELMHAGIEENPVERCYLCKKYIFQSILKKAKELGANVVLEGTNEDDLHVYRPGIRAVRELGVISPLAEAGLTKEEVRSLAERFGVSTAKRPAAPCLATRFPYGTHLTEEALKRVERGEDFLKELGFWNLRLRVHGDIVRMEVGVCEMPLVFEKREEITKYLKELGYSYITLDLEGFRSGSMDIHLQQ